MSLVPLKNNATEAMRISIILIFLLLTSCKTMRFFPEIQLTNDLTYHHDLDNNDNFSPDNQWLV